MKLFLLASVLFLHLVAAMPTPVLPPHSCTTITPKSLTALDNSSPDLPFPQGLFAGSSSLMIMHNNINATNPTHSLQLIEFAIPQTTSGATGACQLQITDPACSLTFTDSNDYAIPSPVQLKAISLHAITTGNNISYNDIFSAEPSLVSSWDFGDAVMSAGDTASISNSEGCEGSVWYVLDYEDVADGGYSEWSMFQQDEDEASGMELNGVYLTYC
ncbi:uncharacterized protein LY89DRAFT_786270 [Mollisia scopiformis]|uniref:Ubiquitin 3 binding protein But2 C-terminal domain-containing protein n=1 Tax=Mollisia scopiformis TaxID=149040 RepID=A0A194WVZ0_MOLSC|nr:uncharacterized protein LY89DRAFT_786270 [Mollisia scopiformis]KUJ12135.1 hypothetical protein LY89DRAFT_786270 [Mollisia scopiformis]